MVDRDSPVTCSDPHAALAGYIGRGMTFDQYVSEIDRLVTEGKTSGANQSQGYVDYTRLNRQRMRRLVKECVLSQETVRVVSARPAQWVWLVITEAWCGDSAQCLPVVEMIASANGGIRTRYVWRDDNPALMDRYLTNGKRMIPKVICLDAATLADRWTWGPRPEKATPYFQEMQASGLPGLEIAENMQRWYLADAQQSIQADFVAHFAS